MVEEPGEEIGWAAAEESLGGGGTVAAAHEVVVEDGEDLELPGR